MPKDMKEPQSYGSEKDWVTGKTGNEVNDQDSAPQPEHQDFYDEKIEREDIDGNSGGKVSPVQAAENVQSAGDPSGETTPVQKVTAEDSGARKDSYFKKRDYE